MNTIDELRTQVEKVFNDEADYDEVLAELNQQIAAHPDSIELLKLRLSLHEAAYDRAAMWQDRKLLLALQPDDLELALTIAYSQYFWAQMFAEQHCSAQLEAAGAYRLDEVDEAEAEAITSSPAFAAAQEAVTLRADAIRAETVANYHALMRQHAHNPDAAQKIFEFWDKTVLWSPWQSYLLLAAALQAQPGAKPYRKREALYLAFLAKQEEDGLTKVPTGYFVDHVLGHIHARTAYDALDAIHAIDGHEEDRELLAARAELQQALGDYTAAAASYRQLAAICQTELDHATEPEAREALQAQIDEARQAATNCEGGSKALQENRIATMEAAISSVQSKMSEREEKMRARFGADYPQSARPDFKEAMDSLNNWHNRIDHLVAAPTEEEKATLREKAASVAARTVGLVRFTPVVLSPMTRHDFTSELPVWFNEVEATLRAEKLEFAGWYQNLQNVEILKKEAPGQLWLSSGKDFLVSAEATDKVRLKRCMSELSDGTVMITADARGSGFYSSGPKVDSFNVFKSTPIAEMVAVHRARLAVKLARHPELTIVPIDGLTRAQEIEGKMKRHANEFRIKYGITDAEIRGMNVKHNAFFAAELKREVAERVANIVVPD